MTSFVPLTKNPYFTAITFDDRSVLSSANNFNYDTHFKKRIRVDHDGDFEQNVHIKGDLIVDGNSNLVVGEYVTDSELSQSITNYSLTDSSRYLIAFAPNSYTKYSPTGTAEKYIESVTTLANNSIFIFKNQSLKLQNNNIEIGKVLTCIDQDGTIDWADPTTSSNEIQNIITSVGQVDANNEYTFKIVDIGANSELPERGFYFYPNIYGESVNNALTGWSNSVVFALGNSGKYLSSQMPQHVICPFSYGCESLVFRPANTTLGTGGLTRLNGGRPNETEQYILLDNNGITIKPYQNSTITNGKLLISNSSGQCSWGDNVTDLNVNNLFSSNKLTGLTNKSSQYIEFTNSGLTIKPLNSTPSVGKILTIGINGYCEWVLPSTYVLPQDVEVTSITTNKLTITENTDPITKTVETITQFPEFVNNNENGKKIYTSYWQGILQSEKTNPKRWGNGGGETHTPYFVTISTGIDNDLDNDVVTIKSNHNIVTKKFYLYLRHRLSYTESNTPANDAMTLLYYQIKEINITIYKNNQFYKLVSLPAMEKGDGPFSQCFQQCILRDGGIYKIQDENLQMNINFLFAKCEFSFETGINTGAIFTYKIDTMFHFKYTGDYIRHQTAYEGEYEPFILSYKPVHVYGIGQGDIIGGLTTNFIIPDGHFEGQLTTSYSRNGYQTWFSPDPAWQNPDQLDSWPGNQLYYLRLIGFAVYWSKVPISYLDSPYNYFPEHFTQYSNYSPVHFTGDNVTNYDTEGLIDTNIYDQLHYSSQSGGHDIMTTTRITSATNIQCKEDIITTSGIVKSCGIAGRRGIPIQNYDKTTSQYNSKGSTNNWGDTHNFFWNSSNNIEFWVNENKVYEQSTNFCDFRIKQNIEFIPNLSERLENVDVFKYDRKAINGMTESKNHIGLMAHELQINFPEFDHLVNGEFDKYDEDGKPVLQSINYNELVMLLFSSVKELKKEIVELKARLRIS